MNDTYRARPWSNLIYVQRYVSNGIRWQYNYSGYYNGKKMKDFTFALDPVSTSFSHGGLIRGDNYHNFLFVGCIDDPRIYNMALSDEMLAVVLQKLVG